MEKTTLTNDVPEGRDHRELKENGQQLAYLVLTPEERAKGFVRPVRTSYRHVGRPGPTHPLRDLTDDEENRYGTNWAKIEPRGGGREHDRLWTEHDLDDIGRGCGCVTTMGIALAETYARNPYFYDATFCSHCGTHLPVGERGEFVWEGTSERVGT